MEPGYICGHEGVGIVHEVGHEVRKFVKGDRVIAPFYTSWYRPNLICAFQFLLTMARLIAMRALTAIEESMDDANKAEITVALL